MLNENIDPAQVTRRTVSRPGQSLFEVKKSKFIGYCRPVKTPEEANAFVDEIRKKHSDARHNVYAWILKKEIRMQKYSDDGEPSGTAGLPVMSVLEKNGITDVAIVVTRYFGGILLGKGGLVRAYGKAAALALQDAVPIILGRCAVYRFDIGYKESERVMFEFRNRGLEPVDIEYGAAVGFSLNVRLEEEEDFIRDVTEILMGRDLPVRIGELEAVIGRVDASPDEDEEEEE